MIQSLNTLLIEDDPSFRSSIQLFLGVNSEITTAGSLAEARTHLASKSFEVVLLDKGLPDGNGLDLLSEIKSVSPFTIVIVLTGDTDFNAASKAMTAGADDYIIKSDRAVVDLMVRIPVALNRISAQKTAQSLSLPLPQTLNDLTDKTYRDYMTTVEKEFFESVLNLCDRDASEVASRLGLSRATIFKKMTDFGIQKRAWARREEKADERGQ